MGLIIGDIGRLFTRALYADIDDTPAWNKSLPHVCRNSPGASLLEPNYQRHVHGNDLPDDGRRPCGPRPPGQQRIRHRLGPLTPRRHIPTRSSRLFPAGGTRGVEHSPRGKGITLVVVVLSAELPEPQDHDASRQYELVPLRTPGFTKANADRFATSSRTSSGYACP